MNEQTLYEKALLNVLLAASQHVIPVNDLVALKGLLDDPKTDLSKYFEKPATPAVDTTDEEG